MDIENFFLEEYKSLRQEIDAKVKARVEFHNLGIIGLAAIYSYIFSNLDKPWGLPWLFWVPVGLSGTIIYHLLEEHRMVAKAATYIREVVEPWMANKKNERGEVASEPQGWETFLKKTADQKEPLTGGWSPVPLWCGLTAITTVITVVASLAWCMGWQPTKADSPATNKPAAEEIQRR
jgi:hypothetical protein